MKQLIEDPVNPCIYELATALDKEDDDMGDDWRRLWSQLIDRPLKEIEVREKDRGPTRFLLKVWCRMKKSSEATIVHLSRALISIYRNDVAEILEKYTEVRSSGEHELLSKSLVIDRQFCNIIIKRIGLLSG